MRSLRLVEQNTIPIFADDFNCLNWTMRSYHILERFLMLQFGALQLYTGND